MSLSSRDLSKPIEADSIPPRTLQDWRDEGLLPKPISSRGLGRGNGREYEYPPNNLERLNDIVDLMRRYPRDFNEVRWRLMLLGYMDEWPRGQGLLLRCFPPTNIFLSDAELDELDHGERGAFYPFWRKFFGRYNVFGLRLTKNLFMAAVYYLIWPYIYKETYSIENDDEFAENAFVKLFGKKTAEFHRKLQSLGLTDLSRLQNALRNSGEAEISKCLNILQRADAKIDHDAVAKHLFHVSIGGMRVIWMARAFVTACILVAPESFDLQR